MAIQRSKSPSLSGVQGGFAPLDSGLLVPVSYLPAATTSARGVNYLAELDYVAVTSNVNITATTEATANTIVTSSTLSYDGSTVVMIEVFTDSMSSQATSGINFILYLYEDGSSIGIIARSTNVANAALRVPAHGMRRITPTAGSHTYSIRGTTGSGTSIFLCGAGGSGNEAPGFIRITRAA